MKVSLIVPGSVSDLGILGRFGDLVAAGVAHRLWLGQMTHIEPHQVFGYLAGSGLAFRAGTAVTLASLRHPYEAAMEARSAATLIGAAYVAGFGSGSRRFVRSVRGGSFASPLTAMREYLTVVRALLDGDRLAFQGRYVTMHGALTASADPQPEVEVGAGVLREGMASVAGQVADTAITWLSPPTYLRERILPALEAGAYRAGRVAPRVVSVVHAGVARRGRDPVHQAVTAAGAHLRQTHYLEMLQAAGLHAQGSDVPGLAAELVAEGVYCYGSPADIAESLDRWQHAGVDEIVINVAGTYFTEGPEAALDDLGEILSYISAAN
ncbi:LLM class flavin-dependent oxidoreductase [Nocardia mexicana]|uniref:Alkanesulfonate monooxygenase SsuD/methylene tetrahydromethanopterin reductase-like flavin-dependent oxidoreductase (Luciferase family) n=1 Tax=Nocardia mexicana TaxID=279262 RepID=A0A370GI44_9NOCA|nr:LLM class flavin-dependent oxidoreductase [Nocardia mexicana]RDI43465.1 alkanesulfonate monooxygenase SsuD/methylene tetrahydromethanopterin reductase-like flavin-dependent oxidoreductase (luciferase family) [Nocardia mexicana]